MKNFTKMMFVAMAVLFLSSCGKEKRLERELKKQEDWNVCSVNWTKITEVVQDEGLVEFDVTTGTRTNAGVLSFYKDGDGHAEFQLDDGFLKDNRFNWEVEDENTVRIEDVQTSLLSGLIELTFSAINDEEPEFNYTTSIFEYTMERGSGDEFEVVGTGVIQALDLEDESILVEQYIYEFSMTLTK